MTTTTSSPARGFSAGPSNRPEATSNAHSGSAGAAPAAAGVRPNGFGAAVTVPTGNGGAAVAAAPAAEPVVTPGEIPAALIAKLSERSVLCAVMSDGREALARNLANLLAPGDFAEEHHVNLYTVWRQLHEVNSMRDVPAILDAAQRKSLFIGGEDYLVALATDPALQTSSDQAVLAAAERIKELSILRRLMGNAQMIATKTATGKHTAPEIMGMLEDSAGNARASSKSARSGFEPISRFIPLVLEGLESRLDGRTSESVTSTGFAQLDRMLQGGFVDEELVILAARPSMGKTAFMINLLLAAAGGRTVGLFTLEQRGAAIAKRALQKIGRIPGKAFYEVEEIESYIDRVQEATMQLSPMKLELDETPAITLAELRTNARELKQKHDKIVIAVDYLQLVTLAHDTKSSVDARVVVSEVSKALKQIARELKCPVIALAQLSRGVEQRASKRPMMSDLRDSGQIEQDADVIMFLYRDDYYNPDTKEPGVTEVILAKQREGATGTVKLQHDLATMSYYEQYQ